LTFSTDNQSPIIRIAISIANTTQYRTGARDLPKGVDGVINNVYKEKKGYYFNPINNTKPMAAEENNGFPTTKFTHYFCAFSTH
jgi:hypothetical protein